MIESMKNDYTLEKALRIRCADLSTIEEYQNNHLQAHLQRVTRVPFYKELFKQCNISPEMLVDGDEYQQLPFTTRGELDKHPEKFGLHSGEDIRDIALTSGTTGLPVVIPYTANDLTRLAFNESVAFYSAGVRKGETALLTVTLDRCFIAGMAYYSGVTSLGAKAIRSGPGQPARQWQIIDMLKPSVVVGVPSFLLEIGNWGKEQGVNVVNSSVITIVSIGEPIRKPDFSLTSLGRQLEKTWGAKLFSSYGATEFETAFGECSASMGGHVHPELMVVEIVDDQGRVLADGEPGEVVVTPLGVEGFPLVRFRTGDISRLYSSPCSCGWNTKRLGAVEGRLAQRLKFKGTTFYPETIFHALQGLEEVTGAYVEVRLAEEGSDDVTVVIGCDVPDLGCDVIEEYLQAHLRVRPRVKMQSSAEVENVLRGDGGHKSRKFFDFRS